MRIAVCSQSHGSVHFLTYASFLASRGHGVTAVTNVDAVDAPVRVVNFARETVVSRALPKGLGWPQRAFSLWRALRAERFDVVSIHRMSPDAIIAAMVWNGPLVLTCWGSDILRLEERPAWVRRVLPLAVRKATLLHATCREIADRLIGMGADPRRISTFNYGVDLDVFRLREREPDPDRILSSRNLRPLYRPSDILRAVAALSASMPQVKLTMAGRGAPEDLEALKALAADLGILDRVEFPGHVTKDELAKRLRGAAVWVSIPESDSLALSLQEAMACGPFPVVADLPSMHEALSEPHALFVRDVSPRALAASLAEALARARTGAHVAPNRSVVEELGDQRRNLPRYEELLLAAAQSRAPRPLP